MRDAFKKKKIHMEGNLPYRGGGGPTKSLLNFQKKQGNTIRGGGVQKKISFFLSKQIIHKFNVFSSTNYKICSFLTEIDPNHSYSYHINGCFIHEILDFCILQCLLKRYFFPSFEGGEGVCNLENFPYFFVLYLPRGGREQNRKGKFPSI